MPKCFISGPLLLHNLSPTREYPGRDTQRSRLKKEKKRKGKAEKETVTVQTLLTAYQLFLDMCRLIGLGGEDE